MPRPKKPDHAKATHRFCVCLKDETASTIFRFASLQGEQAGPIVRRALERVFDQKLIDRAFGMRETHSSSETCYGDIRQPANSTMRYVLTDSLPSRVVGAEAGPSALGQREE